MEIPGRILGVDNSVRLTALRPELLRPELREECGGRLHHQDDSSEEDVFFKNMRVISRYSSDSARDILDYIDSSKAPLPISDPGRVVAILYSLRSNEGESAREIYNRLDKFSQEVIWPLFWESWNYENLPKDFVDLIAKGKINTLRGLNNNSDKWLEKISELVYVSRYGSGRLMAQLFQIVKPHSEPSFLLDYMNDIDQVFALEFLYK